MSLMHSIFFIEFYHYFTHDKIFFLQPIIDTEIMPTSDEFSWIDISIKTFDLKMLIGLISFGGAIEA